MTPTPTPTRRMESPTPRYTDTPTSQPPPQPQGTPRPPDPACQSVVEGYVIDASGERTSGATVLIEGEGWSSGMLTDDQGHYGFGGLCAGLATIQAFLPGGQASQSARINLPPDTRVYCWPVRHSWEPYCCCWPGHAVPWVSTNGQKITTRLPARLCRLLDQSDNMEESYATW
jgi:hypothetical protein